MKKDTLTIQELIEKNIIQQHNLQKDEILKYFVQGQEMEKYFILEQNIQKYFIQQHNLQKYFIQKYNLEKYNLEKYYIHKHNLEQDEMEQDEMEQDEMKQQNLVLLSLQALYKWFTNELREELRRQNEKLKEMVQKMEGMMKEMKKKKKVKITIKDFLAEANMCSSTFSRLRKQGSTNVKHMVGMIHGMVECCSKGHVVDWLYKMIVEKLGNDLRTIVEKLVDLLHLQGEAQAKESEEKQRRIKETEAIKAKGEPCEVAMKHVWTHARGLNGWLNLMPHPILMDDDKTQLQQLLQRLLQGFTPGVAG